MVAPRAPRTRLVVGRRVRPDERRVGGDAPPRAVGQERGRRQPTDGPGPRGTPHPTAGQTTGSNRQPNADSAGRDRHPRDTAGRQPVPLPAATGSSNRNRCTQGETDSRRRRPRAPAGRGHEKPADAPVENDVSHRSTTAASTHTPASGRTAASRDHGTPPAAIVTAKDSRGRRSRPIRAARTPAKRPSTNTGRKTASAGTPRQCVRTGRRRSQ